MKARLRIIVAATIGLLCSAASSLALAQAAPDVGQNTAAPAQNDVVGPAQLQGFSLNGTVTRQATAPVQQAPAQQTQRNAAQATPPAADQLRQAPTAKTARQTASPAPAPDRSASAEPQQIHPEPNAPSPAPASRDIELPTTAGQLASSDITEPQDSSAQPQPAGPGPSTTAGLAGSGMTFLPWLVAALALAGAAAWFIFRQRPQPSYAAASAGGIDLFEAPSPAPAPAPAPAPPVQPAAEPASSGIVSTRLRPWLEIEFTPQRAVVDDQRAAVAFELSVFNSGSMPARDVLLEASLFNAGPMQDQQIQLFFDNPVAKGDKIPVIPPQQKVTVNTAVFLPREKVVPIEMEGRSLLVPLIAFNILYGWGSNSGQTSASYLVGKKTETSKLAPFRLDLGPRIFRNLDKRANEKRLRK